MVPNCIGNLSKNQWGMFLFVWGCCFSGGGGGDYDIQCTLSSADRHDHYFLFWMLRKH